MLRGAFRKGLGVGGAEGGEINSGDVAWMLTASGLVLLMTPGLSFFYGGMVSFKNVVSTMLQSVVALGIISLVWVVVGFSLAFGDDIGGVIGNPDDFSDVRRRGRGDACEAVVDDPADRSSRCSSSSSRSSRRP